ncbi:MAG: hypothetical protein COA69_12545 [Robiginitomaculum sp.]|nr:MAG: hypothetical protein COA69_12545 [Robiginitomaculum sp.]
MAITDKNTVLVLGAGVSAPFGLSLGGGLMTEISKQLNAEKQSLSSDETEMWGVLRPLKRAATNASGFYKMPLHGAIASKHLSDQGALNDKGVEDDLRAIDGLITLLNEQTSETIDDFIVENSSCAELVKVCIAALFLKSCYRFGKTRGEVHPFSARQLSFGKGGESERNWIHLLINIIRQGIHEKTVSSENKIQIITFNYDKILEFVLDKQFSNTELLVGKDYRDYIDIIHVHGECGDLKDVEPSPAKVSCDWAGGIHVVNEDVPEQIKKQRNKAREIIRTAKELYFCGFSFSGPNCRLLGLDMPSKEVRSRTMFACNYDGNVGVLRAVKKYEVSYGFIPPMAEMDEKYYAETTIDVVGGSVENPLSVSDWLKMGHLGELPG